VSARLCLLALWESGYTSEEFASTYNQVLFGMYLTCMRNQLDVRCVCCKEAFTRQPDCLCDTVLTLVHYALQASPAT